MAKTRNRTKRPKQPYLDPSMEPPHFDDLDALADHYYDVMTERCQLSRSEDEAKTALIEKMIEHGLTAYTTLDGLICTVVNKNNIRCKKKKDAESNGEAE